MNDFQQETAMTKEEVSAGMVAFKTSMETWKEPMLLAIKPDLNDAKIERAVKVAIHAAEEVRQRE